MLIDLCDENPLFVTQWSDITQNYATIGVINGGFLFSISKLPLIAIIDS